jgi:hypothetical protein
MASASDESFGQKIKRAAQEKVGSVKKHKEQVEKNKSRYRKPQRQPATKGE